MEQTQPLLLTLHGAPPVAQSTCGMIREAGLRLPWVSYLFSGVTGTEGLCLVRDPKLHYLSVYVLKRLQKGEKEGVTIHFQSNTHFFWPEAPWPAFPYGDWKSHV